MSTLTPINGWSLPALTDSPNITSAVNTAVSAIDSRVNPIFSTTAARNAAIPSPTEGMECYVTGTKEKYIYNGTAWIGATPRFFIASADQTVTDSNALNNSSYLTAPVEANSTYLVHTMIKYFSNSTGAGGNDFQLGWSVPASSSGYWNTWGADVGVASWTGNFWYLTRAWTTADALGTQNAVMVARPGGVLITSGTSGSLTFQFAENTGVAGVTSVTLGQYSVLQILKIG